MKTRVLGRKVPVESAMIALIRASEVALENIRDTYDDDTPQVKKLAEAIRKARKSVGLYAA